MCHGNHFANLLTFTSGKLKLRVAFKGGRSRVIQGLVSCTATHPGDVGDDFEGDSAARDGAAWRHPLQQALSKTLQHKVKKSTRPMWSVTSEIAVTAVLLFQILEPSAIKQDTFWWPVLNFYNQCSQLFQPEFDQHHQLFIHIFEKFCLLNFNQHFNLCLPQVFTHYHKFLAQLVSNTSE